MATIYEEDDWYELQEDNEQIARDEAWEEYMSTGIDPTGGELGPDFDPETSRLLTEENSALRRPQRPKPSRSSGGWTFNWHDVFVAAGILFFIYAGINALVKNNQEKKEKARIEQQKAQEAAKPKVYTLPDPGPTQEEKAAEAARIREDVKKMLHNGRGLYGQGVTPPASTAPAIPKTSGLPQRGTAYGDGYWDGYEEGFDDADGHNTYGFKYNEATNKYSGSALDKYVSGYRKGYKDGWEEGIEQLQDRYDNGDDELDEDEF